MIYCIDCKYCERDLNDTVNCHHEEAGTSTPFKLVPWNSKTDSRRFPNRNNDCELFEMGKLRMAFLGAFKT